MRGAIMVLGDAKSGKTSLWQWFMSKGNNKPYKLLDTYTRSVTDRICLRSKLRISDTHIEQRVNHYNQSAAQTGNDKLKSNAEFNIYNQAQFEDALVYVYDLSSPDAKDSLKRFCENIEPHIKKTSFPLFIVGTKADAATDENREYLQSFTQEGIDININKLKLNKLKLQGVYMTSAKDPGKSEYNQCINQPESCPKTLNGVVECIEKSPIEWNQHMTNLLQPTLLQPTKSSDLTDYQNKVISVAELRLLLGAYKTTSMFGMVHSIIQKLSNFIKGMDDKVQIKGKDITDRVNGSWCCCFGSKQHIVEKHLQQGHEDPKDFKANTEQTLVNIYRSLK